MERERSRQEQTADTDKLYPQIAEALNISISQLEQYPSDMKQILCQAYINNCELGKDDVAETLNGIVNLDIDEVGIKEIEKQQDNTAVDNELRQTEVTERKNKRSYLLSRNQILQNARTIADSDISHKCIKQQVLTYPTDKIIVKGNRNIDIINKSYNNKTSYLVKTKYDNKDFKLPMVKLSDKDRDMLERIVTGEFGGSYVGSCLIAQSIKCAIVYDGYTSVSAVIKGMGYVGSTANRSQNAVNAVKYIFDDNNLAVRHRLFYMCTKDYYDSTPGNFHSTQNFILQYENVLFFDRW